jgi:imidazolonepropionase-like amidohydrolase
VDVVKYCSGGGVLATPVDQDVCELPLELQRAIVAEAHELGLRVAAHAQGPRAIRTAVEAGVDSIEHGGLIDEAAAKAMKEHGTVLVPTLHRMTWKLEQAERAGAPVEALAQLEEAARITLASAKARGRPGRADRLRHGRHRPAARAERARALRARADRAHARRGRTRRDDRTPRVCSGSSRDREHHREEARRPDRRAR